MARKNVKRVGERGWLSKQFLTPKQAKRPRKGAPKGLIWSHALPREFGQIYTAYIPGLHRKR